MATITEDYVSFETAKLLKEKGFDARCPMIYTADGELLYTDVKHHNMYAVTNKQLYYYTEIIAPSQAIAMKWLREVHNLYVDIRININNSLYSFQIYSVGISGARAFTKYRIKSYEAACEEAILYCLKNLI